MKTVLIPTDFSSNALKAALFALQLYKEEGLNIVLLHTRSFKGKEDLLKSEFKKIESANLEALKRVAKYIQKHSDLKLNINLLYEIGDLLQIVGGIVRQNDIDMIMMGTKGETPKSSTVFGSMAADMVQYIDHPLIVVPELGCIRRPKSILFAADYKDFSNPDVLDPLSEAAHNLNAHMEILYVLKKGEVIDTRTATAGLKLSRCLRGEISHTFHFLEFDNPTEGILTFIIKNKPDMLAMVARHGDIYQELLHKSTTNQITLHLLQPLLVLHDQR